MKLKLQSVWWHCVFPTVKVQTRVGCKGCPDADIRFLCTGPSCTIGCTKCTGNRTFFAQYIWSYAMRSAEQPWPLATGQDTAANRRCWSSYIIEYITSLVHVDCVQLVPWLKEMLSSVQMVLSRRSSQFSAAHRLAGSASESTQSAELLAADINKKKAKTKKI